MNKILYAMLALGLVLVAVACSPLMRDPDVYYLMFLMAFIGGSLAGAAVVGLIAVKVMKL